MAMFRKFNPAGDSDPIFHTDNAEEVRGEGTNLADLILQKIAHKETAEGGRPVIHGGGAPEDAVEIPAKLVDVFQKSVSYKSLLCTLLTSTARNQMRSIPLPIQVRSIT